MRAPSGILGRVGIRMLGAKALRIQAVIVIVDGMLVYAGASRPASGIKIGAIFPAHGDSAGDRDPPGAPGGPGAELRSLTPNGPASKRMSPPERMMVRRWIRG